MGDAIISRRGGATLQALAPTITEIGTDVGTIVFTLTNNDASTAVIVYETNDELPDKNSIKLAGGATSGNLTITNLTASPAILYASANIIEKVKSNITEKLFTFTPTVYTVATGGTTLEYDEGGKRFRTHTFLQNGTFSVQTTGDNIDDRNRVDYLIIAGGGGAAHGGGGGGGFRRTNGTLGGKIAAEGKVTISNSNFAVVVGAGGAGSINSQTSVGSNGSNSSVFGRISTGGGRGGFRTNTNLTLRAGANGGCGGGGGAGPVGSGAGGGGVGSQGFDGGAGNDLGAGGILSGGGGGGAGANGAAANTAGTGSGGNGGAGLANNLRIGSNELRAGGGGGQTGNAPNGLGGSGGGGNAGGNSGTPNTGGGGGGINSTTVQAGSGGSGIVIIRYEIESSV